MGILASVVLFSGACTKTLVQPFDQKLVDDLEALYKDAAHMIVEGQSVSPRTSEQLNAIQDPEQHPGHFSNFESRYDDLIVDSEALFLWAVSRSYEIDTGAIAMHGRIDSLINAALPSACPKLQEEFNEVGLTARNYVDLKCLLLRWKEDHRKRGILKKAIWEGRKRTIFDAVYIIQKTEIFKKDKEGE
jgi:hypothetical protein